MGEWGRSMIPSDDGSPPAAAARHSRTRGRRRGIGLSLRALMLVVSLLGGGLGWLAYRARAQHQTVAAILAAGGRVVYDWSYGDRYADPPPMSAWRKWLVGAVGPDYVQGVACVSFVGPGDRADDALMARVSRLRGLRGLYLRGAAVTDAGLAHLRHLTRLEDLAIVNQPSLTDAGLVHLSGLTRLRHVDLDPGGVTGLVLKNLKGMARLEQISMPRVPVDDDDLVHLAGLTALESLKLSGERLTDAGLAHLRGLTGLKHLELPYYPAPGITSAGLAHLGGMMRLETLVVPGTGIASLEPLSGLPRLTALDLRGAPIDDAGLAPVAGFRGLGFLSLEGTRVGDAGLAHLAGLTGLGSLNLAGTRVTDAGLAHLAGLRLLRYLSLGSTRITDDGLAGLGLTRLLRLELHRTAITDAGLARLLASPVWLDYLNLAETGVTDAGLGLLAARGGFQELVLTGTKATPAGVAALRKALPGVWIMR